MSRTEMLADTGTMRALPDLPRRMVSTPVARSTSPLSRATMSARNERFRRHFVSRIDPAQPLGKLADHHQASGPGLRTRFTELILPPKEQLGGDVIHALGIGESNKSAQHPCRSAEVKSQPAA